MKADIETLLSLPSETVACPECGNAPGVPCGLKFLAKHCPRLAPPSAILPNDSTSIPSQRLASSEARPGTTPDEPVNGETHQRRVAPRSGSGEGVSQADRGESPPSLSSPDKPWRTVEVIVLFSLTVAALFDILGVPLP